MLKCSGGETIPQLLPLFQLFQTSSNLSTQHGARGACVLNVIQTSATQHGCMGQGVETPTSTPQTNPAKLSAVSREERTEICY
ncbi:hypothetical protein UPYG_G00017720 [Umbra pygmaea]|uniref:Uncharacterized protein n=1 Tax=Umbra pygmaea TaxID=75934 RepID=A0ABD0XK24_UMBPY